MDYENISSKDNSKIKNLKKLKQKKYRESMGKFFVENLVIISDALTAGFKFDYIFLTKDFILKNKEAVKKILDKCGDDQVFIITSEVNKSFSNLENPSGVCALYSKSDNGDIDINEPIVYLNSIGDPGNLGTILRSALAFGLKNIVLDETCADLYNHKTINAAKDSIFKLNILEDENLEILKNIKQEMPIISTQLEKSKDLNILDKLEKFCIVLGDESNGVDKKIQKLEDQFVKIKMSKDIESLNVASAAAIIFYKIYNK